MRKRARLRDQREREFRREKNKYVVESFSLRRFFERHTMDLALLVIMAAGITWIILLGPDKKAIKEMSASISSGIGDRSQQWAEAYPYGYKIIALTDKDIIHTLYDTLPKDLKIDWNNLSVARVQSAEFGRMNEKIEMALYSINYAPEGVSNLDVKVSFIRKKGAMVRVANLGQLELVVEVIENNEGQLFCLFGLREQ